MPPPTITVLAASEIAWTAEVSDCRIEPANALPTADAQAISSWWGCNCAATKPETASWAAEPTAESEPAIDWAAWIICRVVSITSDIPLFWYASIATGTSAVP